MSTRREAIELPWWAAALAVFPLLVVAMGLVIPQPFVFRGLAILPAAALIYAIERISTRVKNPSMQSVWISTAFGLWAIFPVTWAVAVLTAH